MEPIGSRAPHGESREAIRHASRRDRVRFIVAFVLAAPRYPNPGAPRRDRHRRRTPSARGRRRPRPRSTLDGSARPDCVHACRCGRPRALLHGRYRSGTNEQLRSSRRQFCACIRWSADGTQIWTVTETEKGLRYTTMDPDGSNKQVLRPDIETLNLVPGFGSADGTPPRVLRVGRHASVATRTLGGEVRPHRPSSGALQSQRACSPSTRLACPMTDPSSTSTVTSVKTPRTNSTMPATSTSSELTAPASAS